ncbi:hypothetical protein HZS_2174 [Henneguya salminicola]|nr:hypothetical protein HZS_2174 [Henneguya salminicola]
MRCLRCYYNENNLTQKIVGENRINAEIDEIVMFKRKHNRGSMIEQQLMLGGILRVSDNGLRISGNYSRDNKKTYSVRYTHNLRI